MCKAGQQTEREESKKQEAEIREVFKKLRIETQDQRDAILDAVRLVEIIPSPQIQIRTRLSCASETLWG